MDIKQFDCDEKFTSSLSKFLNPAPPPNIEFIIYMLPTFKFCSYKMTFVYLD